MTTLLTEIADYLASQSWQIAVLIAVVAAGCWLLAAAGRVCPLAIPVVAGGVG